MTLETYAAMTDRFEGGTLDAEGFTHVDHIGVACSMLRKYGFLNAASRYGTALQAVAGKAGVPEKFNTTLTLAFLSILAERMADTPHESFEEFMEKNPDLVSRSLLAGWYSDERLGSAQARQTFLMPDRFQA